MRKSPAAAPRNPNPQPSAAKMTGNPLQPGDPNPLKGKVGGVDQI